MSQIDINLDDYIKTHTIFGSNSTSIARHLYALGHINKKPYLPVPKSKYGLVFFTRPQLNLTDANLRTDRLFYPLLTNEPTSIHRFVRNTLDPRLDQGWKTNPSIKCPLVDPKMAFIPILTHSLVNLSGVPDIVLDTFTSNPGNYKEQTFHIDGVFKDYKVGDIDATFRNTAGEPIKKLFFYWALYMQCVFEGTVMPYTDYIKARAIDYQTRIYIIVINQNRVVESLLAVPIAAPVTVSIGKMGDYNSETPYNLQNQEIQQRFIRQGMRYIDPLLIKDFNVLVGTFNPELEADQDTGKLLNPEAMRILINSEFTSDISSPVYPHINPESRVLEWYTAD